MFGVYSANLPKQSASSPLPSTHQISLTNSNSDLDLVSEQGNEQIQWQQKLEAAENNYEKIKKSIKNLQKDIEKKKEMYEKVWSLQQENIDELRAILKNNEKKIKEELLPQRSEYIRSLIFCEQKADEIKIENKILIIDQDIQKIRSDSYGIELRSNLKKSRIRLANAKLKKSEPELINARADLAKNKIELAKNKVEFAKYKVISTHNKLQIIKELLNPDEAEMQFLEIQKSKLEREIEVLQAPTETKSYQFPPA